MSTPVDGLSARDEARIETLQVIVREETPFLPKVAFTLITLASMGGAVFTGIGLGIEGAAVLVRWLTLWSIGLVGGFLVWRLVYLHRVEAYVDQDRVDALNATALSRADGVGRWTAAIVAVGSVGAFVVPALAGQPMLRAGLVTGSLLLAALLLAGVSRRAVAMSAAAVVVVLVVGWAFTDVGSDWRMWIRVAHLSAFSLWLGGALWNIFVAMPSGRQHPYVDAVLAGAKQLDRFRWVVRFAMPTIIVTGLIMAGAFSALPLRWWTTFPGILIPLKVLAIVALIAVFIACPLFRHCSPVQGVCNIDDLDRPKQPAS